MSKINDLIITESENYLSALMLEKLPSTIIFHNFNHAVMVKKHAETIGLQAGLTADEMNILRIAALFHDTGYVHSHKQFNDKSIQIASAFLAEQQVNQETIDYISEIISSVKLPQTPKDKISEILCDADLMYIASENGLEQFDLLFEETALIKEKNVKRQAFEKIWIDFFSTHTFFTDFGKSQLQPKKEAVIQRLKERMKRRKLLENKKEPKVEKTISYSRGVETLFRITARNQINLNSIADNKSNILISVNAIIISIIITMLVRSSGIDARNLLPTLVLLFVCLVTIIIAIISTRPIMINKKFTEEDIKNKNVDLIFFGNFIKMEYDDYAKALKEMLKDDEHLYSTIIKNQYSLGKILSKKFRLVKIAYNVFMVGIIITVILFLVNLIVNKSAVV